MKKKVIFLVVLALAGMVVAGVYVYQKNAADSRYVTNKVAARMLALLENDFDTKQSESGWEDVYINYLTNQKCFNSDSVNGQFKDKAYTYESLRMFMNAKGVDAAGLKEATGVDVNRYNGRIRVKADDFGKIYDYLINVLDKEGAIKIADIVVSDPDGGGYDYSGISTDNYLDTKVRVYLRGKNVIKVISKLSDSVVYRNAWLLNGEGKTFTAYIDGYRREFKTGGLSCDFNETIGDIYLEKGKVTGIVLKNDTIHGKVFLVTDEQIGIEGYGVLPVDSDFSVYRTYAGTEAVSPSDILVGYDLADFYVADGKVCGAVIKRALNADNICVLIMTGGFTSIFHERVSVTSDSDFYISTGDVKTEYKAGEIVDIYRDAAIMSAGRVCIEPSDIGGRIKLMSVKRAQGNPSYRGSLYVSLYDEGLVVVNELPLEEYLYAVVPSEMPVNYGVEALKTQAVCARSYAYRHILGNTYARYGAHVDDSVNFQVYNNSSEKEDSTQAVKETYGEVVGKDGNIVSTYYYSTSCGHSSSSDIWGGQKSQYLPSKTIDPGHASLDLSDEEAFSEFIDSQSEDDYDYGYPYYRWNVSVPLSVITESVNSNIYSRYYASPDKIKVKRNDEWVSEEIRNIGNVTGITVCERSDSGAIRSMIITGTDETVKIIGEYNVRLLLGPKGCTVNLLDGTRQTGMLPSAYFKLTENTEDGKLTGYTLYGGGYGHGIGMSQNAVYKMVSCGMKYDEILAYFYEGTTLMNVYQNG